MQQPTETTSVPPRRQPPTPARPGPSGAEEIVYTCTLPDKAPNPDYVLHGFAVQTSGWMPQLWRFYRSFEPAYIYGRTARMGEGVLDWDLHPAAFSSRFVPELDREVTTLHVDVSKSLRQDGLWANDRAVVERFLENFDPADGSWPLDS